MFEGSWLGDRLSVAQDSSREWQKRNADELVRNGRNPEEKKTLERYAVRRGQGSGCLSPEFLPFGDRLRVIGGSRLFAGPKGSRPRKSGAQRSRAVHAPRASSGLLKEGDTVTDPSIEIHGAGPLSFHVAAIEREIITTSACAYACAYACACACMLTRHASHLCLDLHHIAHRGEGKRHTGEVCEMRMCQPKWAGCR